MAGVFEFPTLAQALTFYNSEKYAPIKAERREAQQARMLKDGLSVCSNDQFEHGAVIRWST
jgi:hypothetical protein